MDAAEFLKHLKRMCNSMDDSCTGCPVYDDCNFAAVGGVFECSEKVENYIATVTKWAKEHPVKTRQSELQKLFPDLSVKDGCCCLCPVYVEKTWCRGRNGLISADVCGECKRDFWLKEIE